MIIKKAVTLQDQRTVKEEQKEFPVKNPLGSKRGNFSFNKEETEEIMEKLMNRIVAKPNLIADDNLNAKIERIFNLETF